MNMRRIVSIAALGVLALVATSSRVQAQTKTMGIVAGVDFSSLSGSYTSTGEGTRTGFWGGIVVGIPVGGGNVMIEPGVLYEMKGGTYDNTAFKGTDGLDYITVPVLFKWSQQPGGKGFYFMAGPSVNFNVSCSDSGTDKGDNSTYNEKCTDFPTIYPGEVASVDVNTVISGTVGLGYSKGRVGIEGRYDWDWGNAVSVTYLDTTIDTAKNKAWAILVRLTK
jgi:hypothetical protein